MQILSTGGYLKVIGQGSETGNGSMVAALHNLDLTKIVSFSYKVVFTGYGRYFAVCNNSGSRSLYVSKTTGEGTSQTRTGTFTVPSTNISKCRFEVSAYGAGQSTTLYITSYTTR